jgi:putative ABC transport system ATP-binding protein
VVRQRAQGGARGGHALLSALAVHGLVHAYRPAQPPAVEIERMELPAGATVALTGASGSGKTTLAYLVTGIERVQRGSIRWGETELATMPERARDAWRRRGVGLVFQDFRLSIRGNVLVSYWFERWRPQPAEVARAEELLERCAVPWRGRDVAELSRGEQQRVAIARALLHAPPIVVADEPTASLDARSGAAVIELLLEQARAAGSTLLAITHDPALIEAVGSELRLDHGRLVGDTAKAA